MSKIALGDKLRFETQETDPVVKSRVDYANKRIMAELKDMLGSGWRSITRRKEVIAFLRPSVEALGRQALDDLRQGKVE